MRPLTLLPVVLLLALGVPPAGAEDEVDPGKALLEQIQTLRKAEDGGALAEAVAKVPGIYKDSEDKSLKGKLRGELGKIVKDDDLGPARKAAVEALVALEDPKAAWKELRKSMPDRKAEEVSELDLAVVRAAGVLAQSRAQKPLIELAYKAKDAGLASAACEALGGYKDDKRGRVKLLEELITIGRRTRPGRSTENNVSPEAQERWGKVAQGVIKGLNGLTGRQVSTFEDWESLWDDYKKRPKDLFVD